MEPAELRKLAFSIAYRMVGSVAEAEDIAQETMLRLHTAGSSVMAPAAFITTVATRLGIDHFRSARVRRETYPGTWLPEPLVNASGFNRPNSSDSISMALLVLLEKLSPLERAVFVLREAFDYSYDEISDIVGKTTQNCRQIFLRAKARVEASRPRFEVSREKREAVAKEFLLACERGAPEDVGRFLARDAVFTGDGGGKAISVGRPVHGGERIARLMVGLFEKGRAIGGRVELADINGEPGALLRDGEDKLVSAMAIEVIDGVIQAIRSVVNPDKLAHLGPLSNWAQIRNPKELR